MLDLSIAIRRCTRFSGALFFASFITAVPLHSLTFWEKESQPIKHFEQDWVNRYFECLDENTEIGEVVDFLVSVRQSWVARGYECPSLLELAFRLKEELEVQGIDVDDDSRNL